jgi:hypothetical protein
LHTPFVHEPLAQSQFVAHAWPSGAEPIVLHWHVPLDEHVIPVGHTPHVSVPPQPSLCVPQVAPSVAHVVRLQTQ